jgi:hypothetical protein
MDMAPAMFRFVPPPAARRYETAGAISPKNRVRGSSFQAHYCCVNADHIPEDLLDEYVRRKLPALADRSIEEHLLICPDCCDRLDLIDAIVAALRYTWAMQN